MLRHCATNISYFGTLRVPNELDCVLCDSSLLGNDRILVAESPFRQPVLVATWVTNNRTQNEYIATNSTQTVCVANITIKNGYVATLLDQRSFMRFARLEQDVLRPRATRISYVTTLRVTQVSYVATPLKNRAKFERFWAVYTKNWLNLAWLLNGFWAVYLEKLLKNFSNFALFLRGAFKSSLWRKILSAINLKKRSSLWKLWKLLLV